LVFNLALSYSQNKNDAQDITQEVFIKNHQKHNLFNPELSCLKTWIYRHAINQSLDFLKAKKTAKRFGFIISIFKDEPEHQEIEISDFKSNLFNIRHALRNMSNAIKLRNLLYIDNIK
jgi:RNA polymerase sigma factor (sigma-70 family)